MKALAFQVSNDSLERHLDDPSNILTYDPSGPDVPDDRKHRRPEPTVIACASELPALGERLAREPAREQGRSSMVSPGKIPDVVVDRDPWPVPAQD